MASASLVLEAFHALASPDADARATAAAALLAALHESQRAFEAQTSRLGALPPAAAVASCCSDVTYAVGRLVKGLSSARAGARQGYALALTEVLQAFPSVRSGDVAAAAVKATAVTTSTPRTEQRDLLLGKVFALAALARAGRFSDASAAASASAASAAASTAAAEGAAAPPQPTLGVLLGDVLSNGRRRPWLGGVAHEAAAAALLSGGAAHWGPLTSTSILNALSGEPSVWGADALALALQLEDAWVMQWHSGTHTRGSPTPPPAPIVSMRAAFASFAQAAVDDTPPFALSVTGATRDFPVRHALWGCLLQRYAGSVLSQDSEGEGGAAAAIRGAAPPDTAVAEFCGVWTRLVEGVLMSGGAARRSTGLTLFANAISPAASGPAPAIVLDAMLSPHILRAMLSAATARKSPLHASASGALSALSQACHGRPDAASAALVALLARSASAGVGAGNDKATLAPVLAGLMSELPSGALLKHVVDMLRVFVAPPQQSAAVSAAVVVREAEGGAEDGGDGEEEEEGGMTDTPAARAFAAGGVAASALNLDDHATSGATLLLDATPAQAARMAVLDSLSGVLSSRNVPELHAPEVLVPTITLLAFHAFATVEGGAAAGLGAIAERLKLGSLLEHVPSSGGSSGSDAAAGALLLASPPLGEALQGVLRARLVSIIHALVSSASTAVVVAAAAAAAAVENEEGMGAVSRSQRGAGGGDDRMETGSVASHMTALGREERAAAAAQLGYALAAAANDAYDVGLSAGALGAPSVSITFVLNDAPPAADDDDEDSDAEGAADEHEERVSVSVRRTSILSAAAALHSFSAAITRAAAAGHVPEYAGAEASRSASALASLLAQGALAMITDAPAAADATSVALLDIVGSLRSTLAAFVKSARAAAATARAAAAAAAPLSAAGSKAGRTPGKAATKVAKALESSIAAVLTASAEARGGSSSDAAAPVSVRDTERDLAVFVDGLLSLLANAGAALRDVVKAGARAGFGGGGVSLPALQPVLDLIASSPGTQPGGGEEDEEDEDEDGAHEEGDDNDDDASVTLDAGGDMSALVGKVAQPSSSVAVSVASATASVKDAKAGRKRPRAADDTALTVAQVEMVPAPAAEEEKEEEEEEEDEDENVLPEEMERHDRALENYMRLRREQRSAGKDALSRALHFRARAVDIVEAALTRVAVHPIAGTEQAAQGDSDGVAMGAHASFFAIAVRVLHALRRIALRARAKEAAGKAGPAGEWTRLAARLSGIVTHAVKAARVPSVLDTATSSDDILAVAASRAWAAAGVTLASQVASLRAVASIAAASPSAPAADACASVSNLILKTLRLPSTGASSSSLTQEQQQPSVIALDGGLVAAYSDALVNLLSSARGTRHAAALFRNVTSSLPSIGVRLLPAAAAAIGSGTIPRAFRVMEAYALITALVRTATAPWASAIACGTSEGATEAGGKAKRSKASAPSTTATTVSAALAAAVPALCDAIAHTLRACAARASDSKAALAGKGGEQDDDDEGAATPSTPYAGALPPRSQKEPLALLALLHKQGLLSGGSAGTPPQHTRVLIAALQEFISASSSVSATASGARVAEGSALRVAERQLGLLTGGGGGGGKAEATRPPAPAAGAGGAVPYIAPPRTGVSKAAAAAIAAGVVPRDPEDIARARAVAASREAAKARAVKAQAREKAAQEGEMEE